MSGVIPLFFCVVADPEPQFRLEGTTYRHLEYPDVATSKAIDLSTEDRRCPIFSGGAGAYGKDIYSVEPGQTILVTVGSGGVARANGGTSSFGNLVSAGGSASLGGIRGCAGGKSNASINTDGGNGRIRYTSPHTGTGGNSPNGGNGAIVDGYPDQVPGGGGSYNTPGAHGRVIVYW
ncbi:MAG: hypothetical protein Q8P93_03125 [bacterium]|nr:hypothetical protein [bacterium]